jgi:hypothetical protein
MSDLGPIIPVEMRPKKEIQPTAYLVLGGSAMLEPSAIAFDDTGELLETVEWKEGRPDWTNASVCDYRGQGGAQGFQALVMSLNAAEYNMKLGGFKIVRVSAENEAGADEEAMADLRRRLIAWIASKCEVNYRAWEAGCSPSPEPLDYVRWARDVLSVGWPDFPGTVPEGERFVADCLESDMESGKLDSWPSIAESLFDQLTAV